MADPRLSVDFEGIGADYATFETDNSTIVYDSSQRGGSAVVGRAVSLSADDTIALANDGDLVLGKLILVESDNFATVQYTGGMTLPGGTSATLTINAPIVGDLLVSARGYIQAATASGASYVQAEAASARNGRGIIVNNDDTTRVKVLLG